MWPTFAKTAGYNGFVRIRAGSDYGPARGAAGFRFVSNGIDLRDVDVAAAGVTAQGAVSLRNGAPTTADFTFTAGPGAFLSRGSANGVVRIVDGGGGTNAGVRIEGRDLAFRGSDASYIQSITLTANGPLSRLPFAVSATGEDPQPYRFAGEGVYSRQGAAQVVTLGGAGRVRVELRTIGRRLRRRRATAARACGAIGGGTVPYDAADARHGGRQTPASRACRSAAHEDFAAHRRHGTLHGRGAR